MIFTLLKAVFTSVRNKINKQGAKSGKLDLDRLVRVKKKKMNSFSVTLQ